MKKKKKIDTSKVRYTWIIKGTKSISSNADSLYICPLRQAESKYDGRGWN